MSDEIEALRVQALRRGVEVCEWHPRYEEPRVPTKERHPSDIADDLLKTLPPKCWVASFSDGTSTGYNTRMPPFIGVVFGTRIACITELSKRLP